MSFDVPQWMHEATRLTRAGDLSQATAAIQAALAGHASAAPQASQAKAGTRAHDDLDVIDVQAREVPDPPDADANVRRQDSPRAAPAHQDDGAMPPRQDHDAAPARTARERMASPPSLAERLRQVTTPPSPLDLRGLSKTLTDVAGGFSLPGMAAGDARARPAEDDPRFTHGTFALGSDARDYKLYVPSSVGTQPVPLVVMLHGCTQDPDDFAAGTRMNAAAEAQGFVVLYPAQSTRMNPQRCWNWFKHTHQERGRGEPALIAGMTRDVMARHPIDATRVYVAGLSAGGAMAAILGDTYPDLFAAVGVHSGLAAGTASDLPSALAAMKGTSGAPAGQASGVPTIVFHGDADSTVHPGNGAQVIAASIGAMRADAEETVPLPGGLSSTRRMYRDRDTGRVVAEQWVVHGAPHAWSGGSSAGSYTESRGPDATTQMLRFFFAHTRRP